MEWLTQGHMSIQMYYDIIVVNMEIFCIIKALAHVHPEILQYVHKDSSSTWMYG